MAFNMKEVAALRGNDKLYAENAAKIDWSGVGGKAVGEYEEIIASNEKKKEVAPVLTVKDMANYKNKTISFMNKEITALKLENARLRERLSRAVMVISEVSLAPNYLTTFAWSELQNTARAFLEREKSE